ncbi:sigma-70 family RNA polymerase sigma factor [Lentisphaera marina]|uniref:sigma-70 family RNA polymerase sigma factor n=1 Tax=Lentisphaera marina TaxID=1111041 RepID=UPI00236616A8|nr:sigma-70 family RNA polymerase sigma factor [Lentisphaera marina]MDD7986545.1 sigma-70 family RNA polymerase sigma factor [Lentisphaera marina]
MTDQWKTKLTLIERAKAEPEDIETWEEFVKFYEPFIGMVLNKHRVDASTKDDLSQIILLKIWKSIPTYQQEKAGFRTWLSTIIRNTIARHFNQLKATKNRESAYHELDDNMKSTSLEEIIENEWKKHLTKLAFERLRESFSESSIQVFILSLDGKDSETIASELELTKDSVFVLRSRVKKAFKKEIDNIRRHLEL